MEQIKKTIESYLLPFLNEHGFELFDIEFAKEFGYQIIRILVDKADGITVEELAIVNEFLSPKIESLDIYDDNYMLEVSSPGAEKKLRNDEEIAKAVNEYIHVETDEKTYEGYLMTNNNNEITLQINAKGRIKEITVAKDEIKLIRLAVKF